MALRRFGCGVASGWLLLLVVALLAGQTVQQDVAQCGRRKTSRIVGGWVPEINSYPMIAALVLDNPMWAFCSATIVSQSYAVTAAHCVEKARPNDVQLLVGSQDYSKYPDTPYSKLYAVDRFTLFPRFTGTGGNDVALVRTRQPIEYNAGVGPVCLPWSNDLYEGRIVDVLGWGRTRNDEPVSKVLKVTRMNVMRNSDCAYYYGSFTTPYHICTFTQGRDFCIHDSGGPLFVEIDGRVTLIGIIGYGGCLQGKPGGSLRVSYYSRWIYDNSRN